MKIKSANTLAIYTFLPCLLSLITLIACLLFMASTQNKQSFAAEKKLIEGGMNAQGEALFKFASDYAQWTDFYVGLINKDANWIKSNAGTSVYAAQVVDLAVMFDGNTDPIFAWDVTTGEKSNLAIVDIDLAKTVKEFVQSTPNKDLSYKKHYMKLNGKLALVMYARVVATDETALFPNDPKPAFAAAFYLTDERMKAIGKSFFVEDLKFDQNIAADAMTISDNFGASIGQLVWTPARPGSATLYNLVLPLSILAFSLFGLSIFLVIQARKQAKVLLKNERAAAEKSAIADAAIAKSSKLAQLGTLTAAVAHEIRNPLGTVRTSAYVLRRKFSESHFEGGELLTRIEKGVTRCDVIISQLLDFARSNEIAKRDVKLDDWLVKVVSEHAESIPQSIAVECDLGLAQQTVPIDPARLQRVLINLLSNAVEAMSTPMPDPKKIYKVVVASKKLSGSVEISVSDTGPGIADDVKDKILQPMFTTKSFGTGLGLSASVNTIEKHGGSITFENGQNGGAIFKLLLPLSDANDIITTQENLLKKVS